MASSSLIQPELELQKSKSRTKKQSSHRIPLVHNLSTTSSDKLSDSQREWLYSSSYDRTIGNQTRQRYSQLWLQDSIESLERYQSIQEVQNLRHESPSPSNISTQSNSSGLEERIKARKKGRHDEVFKSTTQQLTTLGQELRREVELMCSHLKATLEDIDNSQSRLWSNITDPKVIIKLSCFDIEELHEACINMYSHERNIIHKFGEELVNEEEKHLIKVSKVLSETLQSMNEIGYLFPHEIELLLDREAMNINLTLLSNRRTYSHLCYSLEKCNLDNEQKHRRSYEALYSEWTELKTRKRLDSFSEFINTFSSSQSSQLIQLKEDFTNEQEKLKYLLINHLNLLGCFSPVQGSKVKVYRWKEKFEEIYEQLVNGQRKFMLMWSEAHKDIHHTIQGELEKIQKELINEQVLKETDSLQFMKLSLLPIFDVYHKQEEEETCRIEKSLSSLSATLQSQFTSVFQYAQGSAHIFDSHVLKFEEIIRDHQTQLISKRKDHDDKNQSMEANLDYVLDRLRQAGSLEEANEYYKQSLQMLEKIKANYQLFHDSMLSFSNILPHLIKRELADYDNELCEYFGVSRSPPTIDKSDNKKSSLRPNVKSKERSRRPSIVNKESADTITPATPTPVDDLSQIIATSEGTSFYILTSSHGTRMAPPPPGGVASTFLTQDEDMESKMETFVTSSLTIEQSIFTDNKNKFRLCFLNHLEKWKKLKLLEIERETQDKEGEFITELELRLHLHEPRPLRVKEDIYEIRTVELGAHEDRIGAHIRGVTIELHKLKDIISNLSTMIDDKVALFSASLSELHQSLSSCNSSTSLKRLVTRATTLHTKSMTVCNELLIKGEDSIVFGISEILTANGNYISSLRLFSEGGNYSNNEIDRYRPRLEKQTDRIKKHKDSIFEDLQSHKDSLESKFEHAYKKYFGNDVEYYMMDLKLLDTINSTLTNTQVQIKTEVALSNSQSKDIVDQLNAIKGKMNDMSLSYLLTSLPPLFKSCHNRVTYLYCANTGGHHQKRRGSDNTSVPPISAIEVTKSILSYASGQGPINEDSLSGSKVKGSGSTEVVKQQRKTSISTKHKGSISQDRKIISFGTEGGHDDTISFLPKIRTILTSTHKKLYSTTEDYYRVKGSRHVTQPDQLPETFKQYIDDLIDRCHSYYTQAETYRIKCIDEFWSQLDQVMQLMIKIAEVILVGVAKKCQEKCNNKIQELSDEFTENKLLLDEKKACHGTKLRPNLGHPDRLVELVSLCQQETDRHDEMKIMIQKISLNGKITLQDISREFLVLLQETVTELLTLYDGCVDQYDIIPATAPIPTEYQLMKDYVCNGSRRKKEYKETSSSPGSSSSSSSLSNTKSKGGSYIWAGLEEPFLSFGDQVLAKTIKEKVKSLKVTAGHRAIIKHRDEVIESYKAWCIEGISKEEKWEEKQLEEENKYFISWENSVSAVKCLYQTSSCST